MSCTVIYGGFNPAWAAGQLEREIIDYISKTLNKNYPTLKTAVVVPSWHEPVELVNTVKNLNPDLTVICSLTDPLGPIEDLINQLPGKIILFGYVNTGVKYDFWAVACEKFFKKYSYNELQPTKFEYLFLNYNRKPHRHRTSFVTLLEQTDLINKGCVTLGNTAYTVGDTNSDYIMYGSNDVIGDVGIPNDVYSLGQLSVWNSSFINVVSETQYEYSRNIFISEKIFKPIIGLRPFIINGSPGIYRWLKDAGFDCFDDLFPVGELEIETPRSGYMFRNHQLIVDSLKTFVNQDNYALYQNLLPRLLDNQNKFYEYARNQKLNFKI